MRVLIPGCYWLAPAWRGDWIADGASELVVEVDDVEDVVDVSARGGGGGGTGAGGGAARAALYSAEF